MLRVTGPLLVMQPCGFCSSWFPVCWHNPVIRPKQRINCSSNSRLPLIHLLKPLSLPQPVRFSTPGLAWRSLRLITSKDLINVLSLYKTVWSAPCIRKGQSLGGIFDCEFLTFFMELWMVGCGRFLSSVCVLAPIWRNVITLLQIFTVQWESVVLSSVSLRLL